MAGYSGGGALLSAEPPILLLHGVLSNGSVWSRVQRELSGNGLHSLAPDLLGYRAAPRPGDLYTLEAVTDALMPLVERERPRLVVGHSMGGIVAMELARRLPEMIAQIGVVGLPVYRSRGDGLDFLDRRGPFHMVVVRWDQFAHVGCRAMHATRKAWLPLAPYVAPRQPREVVEWVFDHCDQTHCGSVGGIIFGNHVERLAHAVSTPVAAYHGTNDTAAPAGRVRELASAHGWNYRLVRGAGHQVHVERPAPVARWIAGLAAGHVGAGGMVVPGR